MTSRPKTREAALSFGDKARILDKLREAAVAISAAHKKNEDLTPEQAELDAAAARVYLLWHKDLREDEKLIGVYLSSSEAKAAETRTKTKPGFVDGGEFEICEYPVNKDHWTGGFHRREGHSIPKWLEPEEP